LEEHQAAEAEKKAKKAAEKKEREEAAKRAARERMAAQEATESQGLSAFPPEAEKPVEAQAPPEEPPKEAPPPEKPAVQEPEAACDDWEDQADEPEPAPKKEEEPPPAPEPVAPPEKAEAAPDKPSKKVEEPAPAAEAEVVDEEAAEPVEIAKEGDLQEPDVRQHQNVVFIGHVDAGKSTTCGNILFLSGMVDERSVEKYMKEAKDKNRESWFLAYIMDTSDEEKAKGKTVEVGRAHFETPNRRFTILDAPGHKSYVPNMIAGASQADIGVLIISARKGEFETGFERGGQTGEHAMLAKTLGVEKLLVCINKMDDDSVMWEQKRYDDIVNKLSTFLEKQAKFSKDSVVFLPISGLKGHNIKERMDTPKWFTGKTLLETLDSCEIPRSSKESAVRIPMLDGYRDMGAVTAIGKVEQGTIRPGTKCIVMPIAAKCTVACVYINDVPMKYAKVGENVTLKMMGVTEDQLQKGFVLCPQVDPIRVVTKFKAMLQVMELPDNLPVMTVGYKAVIHVHVASEECEVSKLLETCSMSNMKKKEKNPKFVRENSVLWCTITLARSLALDAFSGTQQLGRFTLRDEGRTIAIGKITELPKEK
jgi:peptide chain release factor subunit 3